MSEIAIRAQGLGKRYRLGPRERYGSLRESLTRVVTAPFRRLREEAPTGEDLWALKDVSFEVPKGQVVGLIGRNGAGKSTLLKILSRITEPTEGEVSLYGRLGALLEVGTGFHPELSGKDNIFLNGALLGMSRHEITRKFDEIVAFSEVERFLDTPVKHYSSGMYMRLAFAVAAHLEPEILLVDEVLAVGDAAFQKKCLGKMSDVAHDGRTIIFVSHNLGAIRSLCQHAIWVDQGRITYEGTAQSAVDRYLTSVQDGFVIGENRSEDTLVIERLVLRNSQGEVTTNFRGDETLQVEVHYTAREALDRPQFIIAVMSQHGPLFIANMQLDEPPLLSIKGSGAVTCRFHPPFLLPQTYTVSVGVYSADRGIALFRLKYDLAFFNVVGMMKEYGFHGSQADASVATSTSMIVPYEWVLPDGQVVAGPVGTRQTEPLHRTVGEKLGS